MNTDGSIIVVGVTGYIASGKSSFCKNLRDCLQQKGFACSIIDVDVVARELRDSNAEVKKIIRDLLGDGVFDENGKTIPSKIRLIYDGTQEDLRKKYDTIFDIWVPLSVKNFILDTAKQYNAICPTKSELSKYVPKHFVIIDCYTLYAYLQDVVNLIPYVIWIKTDIETQIKRLESKRNKSREESLRWIQGQMKYEPIESFQHKVDFTFDNSGEENHVQEYAQQICDYLLNNLKIQ